MLSDQDKALIEAARAAIRKRYRNDWQEVGAAMRTRSGQMLTGVNLDAYLGRMAVCAEAVALGRAVTESGEAGIETIVAVRHPEPSEPEQAILFQMCCYQCCGVTGPIHEDEGRRDLVAGFVNCASYVGGPSLAAITTDYAAPACSIMAAWSGRPLVRGCR